MSFFLSREKNSHYAEFLTSSSDDTKVSQKKEDTKKIKPIQSRLPEYSYRVKFAQWFKKVRKSFGKPLRQILLWYLIITLMGALFLWAPFTQQDSWKAAVDTGHFDPVSFIDALFVSSSSFSDTGLSPVEISIVYNTIGQTIISILIVIGGIGWFGIKLFIIQFFIRKTIDYKSINTLNKERSYSKVGSTFDVIKVVIFVEIFVILFFGIFMSLGFLYADPTNPMAFVDFFNENSLVVGDVLYTSTWIDANQLIEGVHYAVVPATGEVIYTQEGMNYIVNELSPEGDASLAFSSGFFLTVSSLNNAGFATIASASLSSYVLNHGILILVVILFVIGGIGFPIIYDIKEWIKARRYHQHFRFSLISKISIVWFFGMSLFVWSSSLLFEMSILKDSSEFMTSGGIINISETVAYNPNWEATTQASFEQFSTADQFAIISFTSMSTRSAGFSTVDISTMAPGALFIFMISMFIGSSPSSTTGGIRNVTLAVIIVSLISFTRGKKKTTMFKREIPDKQVRSAYSVLVLSLILVMISSLLVSTSLASANESLSPLEEDFTFFDVMFETFSAFGTTGLSTGLTPHLNTFSLVIIIMIMFIGQLGLTTLIGQFTPSDAKVKVTRYPEEEI